MSIIRPDRSASHPDRPGYDRTALGRTRAGQPGPDHPDDDLYFDADGFFRDPELAATHAIAIQGGRTTPERECARMILAGGGSERNARAWMNAKGIRESDLPSGL